MITAEKARTLVFRSNQLGAEKVAEVEKALTNADAEIRAAALEGRTSTLLSEGLWGRTGSPSPELSVVIGELQRLHYRVYPQRGETKVSWQ